MNYIKYLGIDWGEKRIGLAIGDSETRIVVPFKVVNNIDEIIKIVKKESIAVIIVGKPLKMRDNKYELHDKFLTFIKELRASMSIPIKTIDERLSSKAADALIGDKKTKAARDAVAAMLILQNYLDKKYSH